MRLSGTEAGRCARSEEEPRRLHAYNTLYFIVINKTKHGNIIFVFLYYERYSTSFIESGGDAHDLLPTIGTIIHSQHFSIFVTKVTHFSHIILYYVNLNTLAAQLPFGYRQERLSALNLHLK